MSIKSIFLLLLAYLISSTVIAAYTGPGSGSKVTSAILVKDANDGDKAHLKGTITKSLGDEKYEFQDETGIIIVEIDDKLLRDIEVNEYTPVVLVGEVDNDWNGQEVDIDIITLLDVSPAVIVDSNQ